MEETYKEEKEGDDLKYKKKILATWEEISAFCA
jgi:hypothetical protein